MVGWRDLVDLCGPSPYPKCTKECVLSAPECQSKEELDLLKEFNSKPEMQTEPLVNEHRDKGRQQKYGGDNVENSQPQ